METFSYKVDNYTSSCWDEPQRLTYMVAQVYASVKDHLDYRLIETV